MVSALAAVVCSMQIHSGRSPLVIGDSISYGAAESLRSEGFGVDARPCRPFQEGIRVLLKHRPKRAIMALGSNGSVSNADLTRAAAAKGELTLVTPSNVGDGDRGRMLTFTRMHPNVKVIDWYRLSKGHKSYFQSDRLHLTALGNRAFARLLRRLG